MHFMEEYSSFLSKENKYKAKKVKIIVLVDGPSLRLNIYVAVDKMSR